MQCSGPSFLTCQPHHSPWGPTTDTLCLPTRSSSPCFQIVLKTVLELSWSGPFYPPPPCPVEPPGRRKPLDLSSQSWEVLTCRVLTTLTSGVPFKLNRGPLLLLWKACCLGNPWQRATAIAFRGYGGRKLIGEAIALLESWWKPCWLVLTPGRIPRPVRDESLGLASSVA